MNIILVAGSVSQIPFFADGPQSLIPLLVIAAVGATLLLAAGRIARRHAPRACPVRRHHYVGK